MLVMVTGSDGYIAHGVLTELLSEGHEVIALGLSASGFTSPLLTECLGDCLSYDFPSAPVPDVLLHLAWRDGFDHNNASHIDDLPRHFHFIERALDAGVKRIAIMGSMHEVGYHVGQVNESTPCEPTTPYGVAKNALRQLSEGLCASRGAKLQWLRGFYLVSDDGTGQTVFSKIVQAERSGQQRFPLTSGKNRYDFLPYGEFCRQVAAAVTQDDVCGIINICSGEAIPFGEYVVRFCERGGLDITLDFGVYPDRPYDSPALWGDDTKIRSILAAKE